MTHNDYQEHISQLIDGELGAKDQQALFLHLSECGECRNFLNSLLALRSSLTASEPVVFPAGFDTRMENGDALQYNRPAAFRLALAASIAFILLMSSLLFGPQILQSTTTGQPGGMVSTAPYGQPFLLTQ